MADPEHLAKLHDCLALDKQDGYQTGPGRETWEEWRKSRRDAEVIGQPVDLRKAELPRRQLSGYDLRMAQMEGAKFEQAQLQGAIFLAAQLEGAKFADAQLERAFFGEAQLEGADFRDAQLEGAKFLGAQLEGAKFLGAQLEGAFFGEAQFGNWRLIPAVKRPYPKSLPDRLPNLLSRSFWRNPRGYNIPAIVRSWVAYYRERGLRLRFGFLPAFEIVPSAYLTGADLTRADLRGATGYVLGRNPVRETRFDPSAKDPYSVLRRKYTGPWFFIIAFLTVLALLSPVAQALFWAGLEQAHAAVPQLREAHADLQWTEHSILSLVTGWAQGFWPCLLTGALFIYNVIRGLLTMKVAAMRDAEERSHFIPDLKDYQGYYAVHALLLKPLAVIALLVGGWKILKLLITTVPVLDPASAEALRSAAGL